jgi:ABC-type multidrug transport system permease subunit
LLLSATFFLCSHVCRLATAAVRLAVALLVHATFLHHTFLTQSNLLHAALLVHALLFSHAALIVHTSLVIHTTPILFTLLLSLLVSMLMRNECLLVAHSIVTTNGSLMHISEWTTDRGIVRMVRMILSLTWRLRERWRWWREGRRLKWLRRGCPDLMLRLLLVRHEASLFPWWLTGALTGKGWSARV